MTTQEPTLSDLENQEPQEQIDEDKAELFIQEDPSSLEENIRYYQAPGPQQNQQLADWLSELRSYRSRAVDPQDQPFVIRNENAGTTEPYFPDAELGEL